MSDDIAELKERVSGLEDSVKRIDSNTAELVDIFKNAKIGAGIIIALGKIAKWVGSIALAAIAIWALLQGIKSGTPPSITN